MSDPHAEPHDRLHDAPQHDEPHAHDDTRLPPMAHGRTPIRDAEAARGFVAMLTVFVVGFLLVRSDAGTPPRFLLEPLPAIDTREIAPPGSAREAEKAGIAAYGEGRYDEAIASFELARERGAPDDVIVWIASARLLQHDRDDEALVALGPELAEVAHTGRASTAAEARWTLAALHDAFGNVAREVSLLRESAADASDRHAGEAAERLEAMGMTSHDAHGEATDDDESAGHAEHASEGGH